MVYLLYELENKTITQRALGEITPDPKRQYIGFFQCSEAAQALQAFCFDMRPLEEARKAGSMVFENYEGYDFMCLHLPNRKALPSHEKSMVYLNKNTMLFLCDSEALMEKVFRTMLEDKDTSRVFDRFLYTFFEKLTVFEVDFFDKLELEISDLEGALIESRKREFVKEIISLRKRLLSLKHYYEQLLNLLDELQENENGLLSQNSLRYFKIFSGKVERHYHNIQNLRDYVTQVREAYQAEIDIDLNSIMKIFTVITAIFLPLTLIVGWYGMNLNMPEYSWPYAYPAVITASIAVVAISVLYFKKNSWF